jgi:hypothetical protein
MNSSLYIIQQIENSLLFKIGKHTGDLKKLECRYATHSPNSKIIAFFPNFGLLEYTVHKILEPYRLYNIKTNRYTEWFKCDLSFITLIIGHLISVYIINPVDKIF